MNSNWYRQRPLFGTPPARSVRPESMPKKKKRFSLGRLLWNAFKRTCMTLGFLVLLLSLMMMIMVARLGAGVPSLPESFVLEMDVRGDLTEHENQPGGYHFGPRPLTIRQAVDALDRAGDDKRVTALVAHLHAGSYNLAHLDELRRAVKRFRESGKFAMIYAPSYGDMGGGIGSYFLASAFEEIWMQPMGVLSMPGLRAEIPFVRQMLEKIGVTPQFFTRKEYKTVFESAMADEMSPESREMTEALIADLAAYLSSEIAADRGISEEQLKTFVDQGILLDHEALAAGLVNHLGYADELKNYIRNVLSEMPEGREKAAKEDKEPEMVGLSRYARAVRVDRSPTVLVDRSGQRQRSAPKVALVYVVGTIMSGGQTDSGSLSDADNIAKNIMEAARDESVRAIVLRIDSPGGSPVASETIRHAVISAQKKSKPVIVSMGSAAASGGYWVAAPADYIFAAPASLTGSIGVAGGKFVLGDLWQKIGVNWDHVSWGDNADIWSFNQRFTPHGEARLNAMMDNVYDGFITRVAEGRDMEPDAVEEIARGRVWTGRQALKRGLVDELGGLDSALDYTAQMLEVRDRRRLNIQTMPKPKTPLEILTELMEYQVGMGRFAPLQSKLWEMAEPLVTYHELSRQSHDVTIYQPVGVR